MEVQPGGIYSVELELVGAENIGPAWLVGAFAQSFPRADVVQVDQYGPDTALVRLRWRGVYADEIPEGATVSGAAQGLAVPGAIVPAATIVSVEDTGQVALTLEQSLPDPVKLAIAGGIFLITWYFVNKIKESYAQPSAVGA